MKTSILTAIAALLATPVLAQTAPTPAPAAPPAQTVELPEVQGATADPTCGGRVRSRALHFR